MEVSLLSHVTNSALIVYLLQFLKRTGWYRRFCAWAPREEQKVHVLMSAIGAWGTSMGMHGTAVGNAGLGCALAVEQKSAAPVGTVEIAPHITVTAPLPAQKEVPV